MATAATSRPSGPVLSIPSYGSVSPNRVKLAASGAGARSPAGKSVSVSSPSAARSRRACMCSPTNHPGSFRCSLHKERKQEVDPSVRVHCHSKPSSPVSSGGGGACGLGAKRTGSALVRVAGVVESGTWARRALAPSPQSPHRRRATAAGGSFRPRTSRLSAVSFAGDRAGDNRQ